MKLNTTIVAGEQLFTADHEAFRDQVRRFVRERVEPHAEEWNAAGMLPRSIWIEMGELGFLGTAYAECFGGSDVDLLYSVVLAEELTKTRVSGFSFAVCNHKDMSSNYMLDASQEIQDKYLPRVVSGELICGFALTEPSGGSDVAAIRTSAVRDDSDFVINGQKVFITNGISADLIIVVARTDPKPARPHEGISLFAVETTTSGFRKGAPLQKMGNRASDTAELFFEDMRVPAANLIGEEGKGWGLIMADLGIERLLSCGIYISACEEMLRITADYAQNRKVFGRSVSEFQVNAHKLAEMYTEVTLAKVFFYDVLRRYMAGENLIKEISMIKYIASDLANKIAYACVSLHGGWGYMKEYAISQWFTDVRLFNIGAGTSEIMKEIIVKQLFGSPEKAQK
ncbi:acyl-CoA dehydrogenase family protein [Sphingobium boeckii]|uniref:Acyl-[acyl-carrier-protein] dehydrogenase MbtN n=1 Tax=Sphingobium boeckii TaxID=1082345 RepID=A0A7W9AG46_9SPHN|nr:acyl-CoA dehydrogenase family protein [Sphingobium boeckii]MBB5684826.1 acyl-CoA dehydrogenase [Sphingobium boeckii]